MTLIFSRMIWYSEYNTHAHIRMYTFVLTVPSNSNLHTTCYLKIQDIKFIMLPEYNMFYDKFLLYHRVGHE